MLKQFKKVSSSLDQHQYICYGLEKGKEGTKHIQAYIQLNNQMTFSALQKYFNLKKKGKLDKFHIEPAKGSLKQNQKYTSKDGDWYEFGEPKNQGARTDIDQIREKLRENPKRARKMLREDDLNFQQVRYVETIQKYLFENRDPKYPPVVIWIWGESGSGKTHKVFETFDHDEVYVMSDPKWLGENYIQQQCYFIDDFRAEDIPFNVFLKMTDKYPYTLSMKGSSIPLKSKYIIITTPESIATTFSFQKDEDLTQVTRRMHEFHISEIKDIDILTLQPVQNLHDF